MIWFYSILGLFFLLTYLNCWRIVMSVLVEQKGWSVSTAFWAGMFWLPTILMIGIVPFNKMNIEWVRKNRANLSR